MSNEFEGKAYVDVRDITDRVDELRNEREMFASDEAPDGPELWVSENPEDAEELTELVALLTDLEGNGGDHEWEGAWYPLTLIREDEFTDYVEELVSDIGDMPSNIPSYIVIDWEATANNVKVDYSSVTFGDTEYLYR